MIVPINYENFSFSKNSRGLGMMWFYINRSAFLELDNPDLTPEALDSIDLRYPSLCVLNPSFGFCAKFLKDAIGFRNLDLIEHIVKIAGKYIFLIEDLKYETALHHVSTDEKQKINKNFSIDTTAETREFYITKKLLQHGSPVNIIRGKNESEFCPIPALGLKTPLDSALEKGKIKIATLLLRHGGISLSYQGENLEKAKKEIMTKTEKLFKLHFNNFETQDSCRVPSEIIDEILKIGLKVELQD